MSTMNLSVTHGVVVEEEVQFTLVELSRACGADVEQLVALVVEGALTPSGDDPPRWRFNGVT
ncbi:MAG: MerR family transcriptional regulator, partial [Candidatus Competibacter sp.]